jgi:hypothetical protein
LLQDIEDRIDQLLQAYQQEMELLVTVPGIKKETAAVVIAEIGVDMEQFPALQVLASWAGESLLGIMKVPGNGKVPGRRREIRVMCDAEISDWQRNIGHWRHARERKKHSLRSRTECFPSFTACFLEKNRFENSQSISMTKKTRNYQK